MLKKLLGINWKTTLPGILAILAVIGKIINDFRTKDFNQVFENVNNLIPLITGLLIGLGLIAAKASDVTGVGTQAASLTDNNKLVTVQGDVVKNPPPGV